jgi:HAD superfamily hydrolase (TIGR01509 family)
VTVRAVVFDFDGVLANSEPLHFNAFRAVLGEAGIVLTEAGYYERYLGFDDAGVFTAAAADLGRRWSPDELRVLVDRKARLLEELERGASVLFPGAAAAVRRLATACPLAIASGARRDEIRRVLAREGLAEYFPIVVAAEDTAASKPAPDPYLRAVALLGAALEPPFNPRDCVAIEDSRWGLQSARAAGLATVGITHTYPAATLSEADQIVAHLDAITWELVSGLHQRDGPEDGG